ncbi:phage tail protein [Kribbella sp. VKM Ac-2568]|uniref:phage tail protein n=1 Tax=Kribbella sp. VKM Ac-2568 TaxID=2512219 RepID=UPI0010DC9629|nr:phage tail protein [Kribbella sp. VKM Ac-2568]TCM35976.1 phage tail-like protein [Kribbella sp. VKM Ac-2568]
MSRLPDSSYHFATEAQWRTGMRDDLGVLGGSLRPPRSRRPLLVPGSGPADGGALIALDPCGRPLWVRPGDRSVRRLEELGVAELGGLTRGAAPVALTISGGQLWLATSAGVERHEAHDLQRLGVITHAVVGTGRRPIALCPDGAGGVWVLVAGKTGCLTPVRLDCWGAPVGEPGPLPLAGDDSGRLAATRDGVVVVPSRTSRLAVVMRQPRPGGEMAALPLGPGADVSALTVDADDRLVLLRADDTGRTVVEVLTLDGQIDERHRLELPRRLGRPSAVVAGHEVVIVGSGGLAVLEPSATSTSRRISTYVTPTLRSPAGQERADGPRGRSFGGWNRAEVDMTLPRGTTMELAWAVTDDESTVQDVAAIMADPGLTPRNRIEALDSHLSWPAHDCVVYDSPEGSDGGAGGAPELLAASIDRPEQYLWLRVTLTTAAGAEPPTLAGLHVSYPSASYVDDLPAVYSEDPASASQLRRLLAPFEVLFDGLDARIDALPSRIDPGTADDEWTPVLLGWLGLPLLEDLAQDRRRTLLRELPQLQEARGTERALVRALEIVTGHRVIVRDHSDEPSWWFLPRRDRPRGFRLGIDTVVAGAQPAPFRAGTAVLGASPLGSACVDPDRVVAERAGLLEVSLALPADQRAGARSIVDRILSVFAPAHCRVVVHNRPMPGTSSPRIGVDLRVAGSATDGPEARLDDGRRELGTDTELGAWALPVPASGLATIDDSALDGASTHLT